MPASSKFDFATQTRVSDAFKTSKIYRSLDVHHINASFEHGQWWILVTLNEDNEPDHRTYAVEDSTDGFDFEEV